MRCDGVIIWVVESLVSLANPLLGEAHAFCLEFLLGNHGSLTLRVILPVVLRSLVSSLELFTFLLGKQDRIPSAIVLPLHSEVLCFPAAAFAIFVLEGSGVRRRQSPPGRKGSFLQHSGMKKQLRALGILPVLAARGRPRWLPAPTMGSLECLGINDLGPRDCLDKC